MFSSMNRGKEWSIFLNMNKNALEVELLWKRYHFFCDDSRLCNHEMCFVGNGEKLFWLNATEKRFCNHSQFYLSCLLQDLGKILGNCVTLKKQTLSSVQGFTVDWSRYLQEEKLYSRKTHWMLPCTKIFLDFWGFLGFDANVFHWVSIRFDANVSF